MPNKPDKYGLKFWSLVEVNSKYVLSLLPYLGKDPSGQIARDLGLKVVMQLVESAGLGSGYNITGDNYFSSAKLVSSCLQKSITYVGTMRKEKIDICNEMKAKRPL